TGNNMRKKGMPNPDQRHFNLAVELLAELDDGSRVPLAVHHSGPIIVRASNPGQYDNEGANQWRLGRGVANSVVHHGNVGINTDKPTEALSVHGNIRLTGTMLQTSDSRVKEDIQPVDTAEQLGNIRRLELQRYRLKDAWADSIGRAADDRQETGVIAQQLETVLPDAVRHTG
ncbi:uncharacterized protein MONBRDRAFT_3104, partial [Monosiga brevicollis MX1]